MVSIVRMGWLQRLSPLAAGVGRGAPPVLGKEDAGKWRRRFLALVKDRLLLVEAQSEADLERYLSFEPVSVRARARALARARAR
jgi:hypothetical protein